MLNFQTAQYIMLHGIKYPVATSTWVVLLEICISQTKFLNVFKHNGHILLSITNMINFKLDRFAVYVH